MELAQLCGPLPLDNTLITGEVGWEFKLFSVNAGLLSSARERSL